MSTVYTPTRTKTRNSSGDEIAKFAKRDVSVYLFILQLYKSLDPM